MYIPRVYIHIYTYIYIHIYIYILEHSWDIALAFSMSDFRISIH